MSNLRRSTRERKKPETVYDIQGFGPVSLDASASLNKSTTTATSIQKKRKTKAIKVRQTAQSDEEESTKTDEEPEEEEADDVEEDVDNDDDDDGKDESDAEDDKQERRRKIFRQSRTLNTVKSKGRVKQNSNKTNIKGQSGIRSAKTIVGGPVNRRQAITALKRLTHKFIVDPTVENEGNSLVVALLQSYEGNKKASKKKFNATDAETSYYTAGLENLAQNIVCEYEKDSSRTEVNLFNLILRSAGSETILDPTTKDLESMTDDDFKELIDQVLHDMENLSEDSTPFIVDTKKMNLGQFEYRKIFQEFWYLVAKTALTYSNDEKSDNARFRVELVRDLVTRMSDLLTIGVPDLRMGLATAVFQMSRAMLEQTVDLQSKLTTAERQLSVAKRSKQQRKSQGLEKQIQSWKRTFDDLEAFVKDMVVSTVIVMRYRDNCESIRVATLEILSQFCTIRPDIFVSNMYLKYFGWMLSDESSAVRLAAVKGLLAPLEKEVVEVEAMDKVLLKFLSRLADMTMDTDLGVQEAVMSLLLKLLRKDFFDNVADDGIWSQINFRSLDPNATPAFRRDALLFVLDQLEAFDSGSANNERDAVDQLETLAQWLAGTLSDSDIPVEEIQYSLVNLVVMALRSIPEHKSLVTNWSAMLRALQSEKRSSKSLTDIRIETVKQHVLLHMFVVAVKLEVSNDFKSETLTFIDPALLEVFNTKQDLTTVTSIKNENKNNASHEELTLALLRKLPDLLLRFKSESKVLQSLLGLPQYFLSDVLNLSSRKKDFDSLCSNLTSIFLESTEPTTLGYCLRAMISLTRGEHARSDEAVVYLKNLAAMLNDRLRELLQNRYQQLKGGHGESSNNDDDDDNVEDEPTPAEVASSIRHCLCRMRILSKGWPIHDLLSGGENSDADLEVLSQTVTTYMTDELTKRQLIYHRSETQGDAQNIEIPKIWEIEDAALHAEIAESISDGLNLLLSMVAWRLNYEIKAIDANKEEEYADDVLEKHIIIRMRERIKTILVLCYEHYIDESETEQVPAALPLFSVAVQEHALRTSGDFRALFLKDWQNATSKLLRACSLKDDGLLIGAGVRFLRSQQFRIDESANNGVTECQDTIDTLLLPLGRGLATNWERSNRREAGAALANITGSGKLAHQLVQSFSRVFKKLGHIRLLEAHMACLRQNFEAWAESEPLELDDRPTEEEMAEFEKATKDHEDRFLSLLNLASRLSSSLGLGNNKATKLNAALFGLVREGIRFAFSTEDPTPGAVQDLPLGCRLPFLLILTKYLPLIRKDKKMKEGLSQYLNDSEYRLRKHQDFEEVYDSDIRALAEFRKIGDFGQYYLEEENISNSFKPRTSLGTEVSSIRSVETGKRTLDSVVEDQNTSPMPSTREIVEPSSARTAGTLSSLESREISPKRLKASRMALTDDEKTTGDEIEY